MRFKRMSEIYSRLVDHTITNTNEINDFSVGSAMRAIYEAISIELEQFYILTRENMREAIEMGVYKSFGFERKPAQRAYGNVQITFHNTTTRDMIIPRGSQFLSNYSEYTQKYETLVDYLVPAGSIAVDVEVHCTTPGEIGNIPEGVLNVMQTPVANVKSVTNQQAFQTGQDEEPIEELRARFQTYIKTLSRATLAALEYGTREVDEVSGVYIDEHTGLNIVYAHDRNGNLNERVRTKIIENLQRYRPAGINLEVRPVDRKEVDVEVRIVLTKKSAITEAFKKEIQNEITKYLNNLTTSQNLILSDLSRVIMNIDRQLIYDVEFLNLDGNIYLEGNELIRAGEVTVNLE